MRRLMFFISLFVLSSIVTDLHAGDLRPIAIVESKVNLEAARAIGMDTARGVQYWTALADGLGVPFRLVDDEALEAGVDGAAVLIVCGATILSDGQVDAIKRFQAGGGALLLVGMPGLRTPDGAERTDLLAPQLAGLGAVRTFDPETLGASSFTVRLGSPLGPAVEPALRFEVDTPGTVWAADMEEPAAYWVDWGMAPLLGEPKAMGTSAAIALAEPEGGRVAWMGGTPEWITEVNDQAASGRRMAMQLLRWLLGRPSIHVGWWPLGLPAATVLTADVETNFENGEAIALMFHRESVRGTFFVLGDLAREFPFVVDALAENGDVGSHSMHHKTFQGRPGGEQQAEIREAVELLHDLGVRRVSGFRPPMEEYDAATLQAVADEGLDFVYGNLKYDRAWPIKRIVGDRTIWQFARIVPDDFNFARDHGVDDAAGYTGQYMLWALRMFDLGGLFAFSFHTNYLGLEDHVETIGRFLRWVKHQPVWITTFRDIVRWVETREAVAVTIRETPATLEVHLSNHGPESVSGFPLIYLGTTAAPPTLLTAVDGVVVRAREDLGHLVLVDLAPGDTKTIIIQTAK
ncbi:MAG: polysaccharide deacetylase family protein [Pseudomonadota bacterium]